MKKFINIPREKERTMKSITIELIQDWKFRFQIIHHINWQSIMLCIRSHVVALSSLFFSSLQCLGNSLYVDFWCRAFTDDVVVNYNILRKSIACLICVWVFQWFVLKAVPHRNYCISNVERRSKNKSVNRSEPSVIISTTIESSRGNNIPDIGQQTHWCRNICKVFKKITWWQQMHIYRRKKHKNETKKNLGHSAPPHIEMRWWI